MKAARTAIQIIRFVMIGSIVLYGLIVWRLPSSATPNPFLFKVLTVLAVLLVVVIVVMRRIQVSPAEIVLAAEPENPRALARWHQGYVVTYVLSEAIVLYGVALHFLGFTPMQVAPFFLAGFALMLYFAPASRANSEFPQATVSKNNP